MSSNFIRTKPSFLEGGLPCASLSAECQRDNNARQRPPQNRLHIWWARRPPTICRAAILAALLPHDLKLDETLLPTFIPEPDESALNELPPKLEAYKELYIDLLRQVGPTLLPLSHAGFLRSLGICGDSSAAYNRMALRDSMSAEGFKIPLPDSLVYRHPPAISVSPGDGLLRVIHSEAKDLLGTLQDEPIVALDFMAGGGVIPLECLRYGFSVYANDLNPVSSLVLKATIEYPAQISSKLVESLWVKANEINIRVQHRLRIFFTTESKDDWWREIDPQDLKRLKSQRVEHLEPAGKAVTRDYLWLRQVPCSKCQLNIPLSTNFHIVNKKGKPEAALAAFPEVPLPGQGNDCTFRIVKRKEWQDCHWPRPGFEGWHPRNTPTFKGGNAICPRCDNVVDGEEVKQFARSRPGGLPAQMYAVCSQVPVKLTYTNGEEKVRFLWRFRAPTGADLAAARAAEEELHRRLPAWEAAGLVPDEEIPEGDKTKEPRNMGLCRWRDLFLPRQLLTNLTVLEEIRNAQIQARAELPPDEAEAVSVYLAFILSKVVNYNSVNTFWDYTRNKGAQTFSRHDFAFRSAFTEFEGARETVLWGASQVIGAYQELAGLIHGQRVEPGGEDDEDQREDEEAPADIEIDEGEGEAESAAEPVTTVDACPMRPEVIVPTVTCEDAAALATPEPGTVHLICVDPPYYNNVQYSELSNFFYVWLKRALQDEPGLTHLFREPLAESNREAVANAARWAREAEAEKAAWQQRYDDAYAQLRAARVKVKEAKERAAEAAGTKPLTAKERADRFYEDKVAAVFRRGRQLLHPAGRMVVMFNHKQTWAWRALGMALIRAGFEVRSSVPIHTEAASSLNIRGLDAARSTILLLCIPREEREQVVGNWAGVQAQVAEVAENAASHFRAQGIEGTDLYLSALGPAIREVARNWPVTDFAGREVDLADVLEQAYRAVGQWRLGDLQREIAEKARDLFEGCAGFSVEAMDRDSQALWLWLDTFNGDTADSDEVRKLAKSLNVDPNDLQRMGLVKAEKEIFILKPPQETDFPLLSRRLKGEAVGRGRAARAADQWEERTFPNFLGAAVWNAIGIMAADGTVGPAGPEALRRWLSESGYGQQRDFFGAFAVTLFLLERVFRGTSKDTTWMDTARHARRAWDLVINNWQI